MTTSNVEKRENARAAVVSQAIYWAMCKDNRDMLTDHTLKERGATYPELLKAEVAEKCALDDLYDKIKTMVTLTGLL